jgi:hypothetical protein
VAGEQADKAADRICGRREGRAHRSRGFHGVNRAAGSNGGGAEEQLRASARGSRELPASVRSSGWCQEVRRWTGAAVHGGSMMVAQRCSGGEGAEEEKGLFTGGGVLLL